MKLKQTTRIQQSIISECGGKLTKAQKYYQERLQNGTAEHKERRLSKQREYKRKQRAKQSSESRAEKLHRRRQYKKQRIEHETPEKRIGRLSKLNSMQQMSFKMKHLRREIRDSQITQHRTQVLQNETPAERQKSF